MITEINNEEQMTQTALTVVGKAELVKITDQQSYDSAAELLTTVIKPTRKAWKEYWEEIKKPMREAMNKVQSKFNDGDAKLERAETLVKGELLTWSQKQERIQQELQRKAEQEAREKAEAERAALAVELEGSGMTDEDIEAAVASVPEVVAAPVQETYQKASGISMRDNWSCEVNDLKALCKAIGAGKVPANYVLPNETALNARARADKTTMMLPGCKAVNKPVVAGRGR